MTKPGKVSSTRAYNGRVISLDVDEVRFPDGSIGSLEMIRHPGASAVVPLLDADAAGLAYGLRLPGQTLEPGSGRGQREHALEMLALFQG
jgi:hypothetical protein